jgi:hypothetical protein
LSYDNSTPIRKTTSSAFREEEPSRRSLRRAIATSSL